MLSITEEGRQVVRMAAALAPGTSRPRLRTGSPSAELGQLRAAVPLLERLAEKL